MREARQLADYGISVDAPVLDYSRLLSRVREVVDAVRHNSAFRSQIDSLGVSVFENAGTASFVDRHRIETESGLVLNAEKVIVCTGGVSRGLSVPGFELTNTHSDAWSLTSIPDSMIVIGAGATGAQVASIFNAFGTKVQLFQAGPRIIPTEDEDVSATVAAAFRDSGIIVNEDFGVIEAFEKAPGGVRMLFLKNGVRHSAEASLAVAAVGWVANTAGLKLDLAGVRTTPRGFVEVDAHLRTTTENIFAAGDITGRLLLAPQAMQDGFAAATNAVSNSGMKIGEAVNPIGSFTDPEYAQVGLTEAKARLTHNVITAVVRFDSTTRTIIDGRTTGFCKLIVDRASATILGCHVVGERAVEIAQVAAIAMAGAMRVDQLAHVPLSFPTYAGAFGRVAASAARQLNLQVNWQASQLETS
jgi:dihydrolipoamide dehydrogenase